MKYTSSELIGNGWDLYQKNFSEWFWFTIKWLFPIPVIIATLNLFSISRNSVIVEILIWMDLLLALFVAAVITIHSYGQFKGNSLPLALATTQAKSKIIPIILLVFVFFVFLVLISIPLMLPMAIWAVSRVEFNGLTPIIGLDELISMGWLVLFGFAWVLVMIYFGVRFALATMIVTLKKRGAMKSIQESWTLSKGKWIHLFITLFLMGLIALGIDIFADLIGFIPFIGVIVGNLLRLFIVPFSAAVNTALYMNVVGEEDDFTNPFDLD